MAGHRADEPAARELLGDALPGVRATALAALSRMGALVADDIRAALSDVDVAVRRRACEVAGRASRSTSIDPAVLATLVLDALDDREPMVVEMACWALGEISPPPRAAVEVLARIAGTHRDALCREAAVAALGAIGDVGLPEGPIALAAILAAAADKPAVRRRAVLALAGFDGPEVEAALRAARSDRDWQVRQAAEDLDAAAE